MRPIWWCRLQHRLHARARELRARFLRALRRHRAGDQAGCGARRPSALSVLGTSGTVAREYTRASSANSPAAAMSAGRLGAPAPFAEDELRGSAAPSRNRSRDRGLLRGDRRRPHRYGGAGLHPLSAADRSLQGWRPGRSTGSIRRRRSRAVSPICCASGPPAPVTLPPPRIVFTSGRPPSPHLAATLKRLRVLAERMRPHFVATAPDHVASDVENDRQTDIGDPALPF